MRPESVEIKVTLSGGQVEPAIAYLRLSGGTAWTVAFCEDVTAGLAPSAPLHEAGVVLRARAGAGSQGDSTIKLRPCRWSQLSEDFFTNSVHDGGGLRIEAIWSGATRVLSASLTAAWADDRLTAVRAGALPVAGLFSGTQRRFLERCVPGRVNLSAVGVPGVIAATRWNAFSADAGGVHLSVRAERWVADGALDLLELSVVSSVDGAARDSAALELFVAERGLAADDPREDKTRRVLTHLMTQALAPPPLSRALAR